ncbi:ABC transporter substrate-binding protein [Kaistia dalseonensis]|uniref:Peptide/nickel transport system substrate-binding protein n=1 Tax=Kaistia dalseonensis TaxID=410840 RepID=A0ABU0HDJ2_9HYPH|nr:ABC transporter substrate-binding protein [Kaistia dalseonensis]MCX5497711.1 ABC transporter substrate-binding protein [Kaistia dalseonensis]MDQ0440355.1 peptide/nickel transport system substrate-binding protein [Kaistia dalseonensis]
MRTTALAALVGLMPLGAARADDVTSGLKPAEPVPVGKSLQKGDRTQIEYDKLMQWKALPSYSEPAWVTDLVTAGKLPPIKDRLPPVPLVVDTASVEGTGVYGGVLRHVSGARPQGWNWMAGNVMAWGGVEEIVDQCLVRVGPIWMLKGEKSEPLPQLAKSWEWSADGHALTMHLIEGAKWSDGQPFSADDVMFMWDDNISDPKVPAWGRPDAFGVGTTLEKVDDNTVRWHFKDAFPAATLYQMGYQKLCPGPAHILKPLHPKYNKDATYDSYINALKPEKTPWVSMGPWTVTDYKPDQIMVMRRNPYFYEVDEKGNQLPYLDEIQYKLSTWEDRTIQTVAGSADYANMEDPSIYLESLKQAQKPDFPNKIIWGARALDWKIDLNLSDVCGVNSDRDKAMRELNRNVDFRRIMTQVVDREALGQSLVRGPFITPYAGGMHQETDFGKPEMVVYYPYDIEGAKAALAKMGFKDTDGDGIVNWPAGGPLAGKNLDINLLYTTLYTTDQNIAQSLVTMFREAGVNLVLQPNSAEVLPVVQSCGWDWWLHRDDKTFQAPVLNLEQLAPVAWGAPYRHLGTSTTPQNLLPFEKDLLAIVAKVRTEPDPAKRSELFREYNKISTENIYSIGLIEVPGAIIVNKRFNNVPPGTPILSYAWGEEGSMRERFWVPTDLQGQVPELAPKTLPGIN